MARMFSVACLVVMTLADWADVASGEYSNVYFQKIFYVLEQLATPTTADVFFIFVFSLRNACTCFLHTKLIGRIVLKLV